PRMRAPQRVERKTELGDGAGLEVLHEHVGLGEDRREQRFVIGAREIEHQRFLAAVEPDEIRALALLFLSACSVRSLSPQAGGGGGGGGGFGSRGPGGLW